MNSEEGKSKNRQPSVEDCRFLEAPPGLDALRARILTPDRNLEFFLAEFVPYFVRALDHICPLCSADSASSGANSAQKSFSLFLSGISIGRA